MTVGPEVCWVWQRDARGQRVAYASLDGTGVPQQGPHKEKAEGKMPWVGGKMPWVGGKMPWVGAVFNPQPADQSKRQRLPDARYVAGLMSLDEVGRQIRRECRAVGVDQADLVIALTDGGAGLQNCLQDALAGLAGDVESILDFYHASEHIHEFAKTVWPRNEPARTEPARTEPARTEPARTEPARTEPARTEPARTEPARTEPARTEPARTEQARTEQATAWCQTLKASGGAALLAELEELEAMDLMDLAEAGAEVAEAHRQLTGYLRTNLHRTDYPRYIANGWQIGSGVIESACKSVVANRLKGPGMRWRPAGTTAMCQLRALFKSTGNLWDHHWRYATAS